MIFLQSLLPTWFFSWSFSWAAFHLTPSYDVLQATVMLGAYHTIKIATTITTSRGLHCPRIDVRLQIKHHPLTRGSGSVQSSCRFVALTKQGEGMCLHNINLYLDTNTVLDSLRTCPWKAMCVYQSCQTVIQTSEYPRLVALPPSLSSSSTHRPTNPSTRRTVLATQSLGHFSKNRYAVCVGVACTSPGSLELAMCMRACVHGNGNLISHCLPRHRATSIGSGLTW